MAETQVLLKNNSFKLTVKASEASVEHFINLLEAYEESIPEDRYLYFDFTDGNTFELEDAEDEHNVEWFFGDYPNFVVFDCSGYSQDLDTDTFCDMLGYLSSFDGLSGIQCNYIYNFKTVYMKIDLVDKVITLVSCFMDLDESEPKANEPKANEPKVKRQQKKIRLSATSSDFFRQVVGN